jgi:predicted ATP-dependent endonuclease of OLD family
MINWVEIENFRSIKDSGKLYFNKDITILAGKNESGKSNILQALNCFSKKEFKASDYPQDDRDAIPKVTVNFSISSEDINKIMSHIKSNLDIEINMKEIEVARNATNQEFIEGEICDTLSKLKTKEISALRKEIEDILIKAFQSLNRNSPVNNQNDKDITLMEEIQKYREIINKLKNIGKKSNQNQNNINQYINKANEKINTLDNINNEYKEVRELMTNYVPDFILFDSFDDILPEKVTANEVNNDNSKIVNCFAKVADANLKKLFQENDHVRKITSTNEISADITGDFGSFYKQDNVKIEVNLDGNTLYFYIYDQENRIPFKPEQRSKGFQWFLSFFLTLSAENSNNSIILIDEPGLYLHAKAQNDVLNVLEDISDSQQILFTTHSPYLINTNRLDQVRLVLKEKTKTVIENKIHKGADKDTMTPLITAIGLDLTQNIIFSKYKNILIEGISDYYYFTGMRHYLLDELPDLDDVRFIPSVGATQISNIVVLLLGWGIEFEILLDNDSEGDRVAKELENDFYIDSEKINFISGNKDHSVEDLFSKEDFNEFVLSDDDRDMRKNNSKIAKDRDKVLLSKKFCELINDNDEEYNLSDKTRSNFIEAFGELDIIDS